MKKIFPIFILFVLLSCRSNGFYQPYTTSLEIPDGPPEYKAGWRAGCRTALSTHGRGMFANSVVYPNVDFGNGAYHHEGLFVSGWLDAAFTCFESGASWAIKDTFDAPLE